MALSIDGTASTFGNSGSSVATDAALTCSNAGNVINVVITTNGSTVSSVSSGGVSFTLRKRQTTGSDHLEYWTGYNAGTHNAVVTVSFTGTSSFATIHAWGSNGAPSSAYFDVNASLPDAGTTDPRTVSTTAADTMIIGAFRFGSTANPTNGTGFTQILGASGSGYTLTEYKIVSAAQTGLSVPVGTGAGNANAAIADAIVQDGAAPAGHPTMRRWGGTPGMTPGSTRLGRTW